MNPRDDEAGPRPPGGGHPVDRTLIVAGLVVIALGALFLLDRLSVIDVRFDYAAPAVLAALGVVLVTAGLSS